MNLKIEYDMECGEGHSPQAVHDKENRLRVIFLDESNLVRSRDAVPVLGLYDDLEFKDFGRCAPDEEVSLPSLKRVAHYGAYGFWAAANANGVDMDHKFVIYMMPTDISKSLIDGSVTFSAGSEVSSLSCTLQNLRGELLNRYRALVTPGTRLEVYFSLGGSEEITLGIFYVDRTSVGYPDEKVSVSARNTIGKLLKEQTFDEDFSFNLGTLQDNIRAVLELAEIEDFFIGDPKMDLPLEFEPETTILEGLKYAISTLSSWKIAETSDGVVGIAAADDPRFDQPSVFTFERDKTCWEYNIEYDDSDAASRVCVYSDPSEQSGTTKRLYKNIPFNKWWTQPLHRTLYVQTVNDASDSDLEMIAETLAASLAESGRVETFAGIFTPQLVIGDEVRMIDENGKAETIGSVTDVTHSFGRSGFTTSFTVDSGGRKTRTRLADLVSQAKDNPEAFKGKSIPTQDGDDTEY